MTAAQKAHALGTAIENLQCGESISATELYVLLGFPACTETEAHQIVQLAGRIVDADPEFVRN